MSTEANVLHKDLRGTDLHPPGPHTHVESDITNLDKYTQAQTDALLAAAVSAFESGGGSIPDATPLIKGKLALAGDLAGTAASPTVPALATKQNLLGFTPEDSANKITDPTFTANSDSYYPSQKATKTYIGGQVATREPAVVASTTSKYWRGDKTFQTLDTSVVPENGNLYYTNGRFDTQFATKTTANLTEGANLYYTDARVQANRLDQMAIPLASVSMNGQKITSLLDPTLSQDAATKAYVDSVASGLTVKASVVAATTANITLSGPQTIDGVSVVAGNRVLVKDQTTGAENGIYVVASGAWSRATDADTSPEVASGMFMFVQQGTLSGNASFVLTTANPITLGTTALTFTQFSGAADLIGGAGLVRTANTFNVVGTVGRILVNADSVDIDSGYVGQASITTLGTIVTGVWNGTDIPVAYGGTGAATAALARANLGAVNIAGDTMTGALTVPNLINSSLTAGSIVYAGTAGLLSQDNANLFYDATNKVLAIGTNTPNANAPFATAAFEIDNTGGAHSDIVQRVAAGNGTHFFAASNGTSSAPTISTAGNGLGNLEFLGYTGAAYAAGAFIGVQIAPTGTVGSTSMPSNILFQNALRKQVNVSANSMIISSRKAITLWGGLSSDPTTANFRVDQPNINLPGVVQTAGTTALVGTETLFTNDFKIGDTINVSGETSRIVATITDDNHLTVTVAFSSSTSSLTYQSTARTVFTARGNGQVGIGTSTPTAFMHLPAGTANATTSPLKFTAGTNLTSPESGAVEFDGTLLYYTTGSLTRQTLATKAYVDAQLGGGGVLTLDSMSTTTRNGLTAVNGMMIYNSTMNQTQSYENSQWADISKSPATYIIAPASSGFKADYYTDGTADEVQINAALTAASGLGGGVVLLKGAAYVTANTIKIPTVCALKGEGKSITSITRVAGGAFQMIQNPNLAGTDNHIYLSDVGLNGNNTNGASGRGVDFQHASNVLIERVYQTDCSEGFKTDNCTDLIWNQCVSDNNYNWGFYQYSGTRIKVINSQSLNAIAAANEGFGMAFYANCSYCEAVGNYIYNSAHNGIQLNAGSATTNVVGCVLRDNEIVNAGHHGISVQNDSNTFYVQYASVVNNRVTGSTIKGLNFISVLDTSVTGNKSWNNPNNDGITYDTCTNIYSHNNESTGNSVGLRTLNSTNVITSDIITGNSTNYNTDLYTVILGPEDITLDGQSNRLITMNRAATAVSGNFLTIQAGGAKSGGTDLSGGQLTLLGGVATGNNGSSIRMGVAATSQGSGTTDRSASNISLVLTNQSTNLRARLSLGTGSSGTADGITLGGNFTYNVLMTRTSEANHAGHDLLVTAGGATSSAVTPNLAGGTLTLQSGISTGTATSSIVFQTASAGSSGTTDNSLTTKMTLDGVGRLFVGGATTPTAIVHLAAGTATANTSPLKFTSGTNLTSPEAGAMEFDGASFYLTPSSTRKTIGYTDMSNLVPVASFSMNSQKITNLLDPTGAQDAATKNYVDSIAQGLSIKPSAIVATTAGLPSYIYLNGVVTAVATGTLTIDGHVVALNDYILVKDETSTNAPYNGLYKCTTAGAVGVAFILTRAVEMDSATEFVGSFVFVESGTANASSGWVCTDTGTVVIGTTNIAFTQFSGAGEITAGTGLTKTGNTLATVQNISTGSSPVFAGITVSGITLTGQEIITTSAGGALIVGQNGSTNPAFNVDTSTATSVTGLNIKSAAAAAGLAISVLSSGTDENLTIDARGAGTISIGATSTGAVIVSTLHLTNALGVAYGGTGQTSYTDGQLLIGNTTGNTLAKATLTAGNSLTVTNGHGTITLDAIQDIRTTASPTFAGLSLGTGNLSTFGNLYPDGTAARIMGGDTSNFRASSGAGNTLTVQAGGAQSGATNTAGGDLILSGGVSTGNTGSNVRFYNASNSGSTGTADQTPSLKMTLFNTSTFRLWLGNDTSPSGTLDGFGMNGNAAKNLYMNRTTTGNTVGQVLTVQAGGATSGATDKGGGNLVLQPGLSTGTGRQTVNIKGYTVALSTGTSDNTILDRTIIGGFKTLTNNSAINIVNATLASNTVVGGIIRYAIEVFDSTNLQMEVGEIMFACVNKGGVFSLNTMTQVGSAKQTLGSGTLTVTWAITGANPAVISINANSSLTPATGYPRITYTIENFTQQAIAIQ